MSSEVVQVIAELKSFSSKYITYNNPQISIVKDGHRIMKKVGKIQRKHCCASYVTTHEWCELEYWLRDSPFDLCAHSIYEQKRRNRSICESHSAFRYEYIDYQI